MIHTLNEELYIIIYLIVFGLYISSTYDAFVIILKEAKAKKIINILLQLFFCILQLTITYFFTYKLAAGYIPIYFILFVVAGALIYCLICRKTLAWTISKFIKLCKKLNINEKIKSLFYSQTVIKKINQGIIKIKTRPKKEKKKSKKNKKFH